MIDAIVVGLVNGAAYAVLAVCIVVLCRLTGVVNLAQGVLGAFGAYTGFVLTQSGMPWPAAVLVGLAVGGAIAGFVGWLLARWFADPTPTAKLTATAVMFSGLLTLGFRLFGDSPRVMPDLVPVAIWMVGDVAVSSTTVVALLVVAVVCGGLAVLLRRTLLGLRLRAMAERPVSLQLLGLNTRLFATLSWMAAGVLSSLVLLLVAPARNPTFATMAFWVLPALAAALLGRFTNVWLAVVGGIAMGVIESLGSRVDLIADYRSAVPGLVIIVALIWLRRGEEFDDAR